MAEPPCNLISKGKMSATENSTEYALVIDDSPRRSGEKDDTKNDEHVVKMGQEMEPLRGKYNISEN